MREFRYLYSFECLFLLIPITQLSDRPDDGLSFIESETLAEIIFTQVSLFLKLFTCDEFIILKNINADV